MKAHAILDSTNKSMNNRMVIIINTTHDIMIKPTPLSLSLSRLPTSSNFQFINFYESRKGYPEDTDKTLSLLVPLSIHTYLLCRSSSNRHQRTTQTNEPIITGMLMLCILCTISLRWWYFFSALKRASNRLRWQRVFLYFILFLA